MILPIVFFILGFYVGALLTNIYIEFIRDLDND